MYAHRYVAFALVSAALALSLLAGCGRPGRTVKVPPPQPQPETYHHVDLPKADLKNGTAIVILVDTSGSMAQSAKGADGKLSPKYRIAREALQRIVQDTADWKKKNPDRHLQVAIYRFSSTVAEVLPMAEFDAERATAAVERIPEPTGGTAIGQAIEEGYKALYRSGCTRKFIVCLTDGENTVAPSPSAVAYGLHAQTQGAVNLEFVAFDTSANYFQFLSNVNGRVVEASNGAQLQAELAKIYEKRILAEAIDEPNK